MSLAHEVARWIEKQPERCASLEQLREQFRAKHLKGALGHCRRNGWLERRGAWYRTDRQLAGSGRPAQGLQKDSDGHDERVALRLGEERFAGLIGTQRYEDVETIRPAALWRGLPLPAMTLLGSSASTTSRGGA